MNTRLQLIAAAQILANLHTGATETGRGHFDGILCTATPDPVPGHGYHDVSTVDGEAWCTTCRLNGEPLRWDWHTGRQLVVQ